MKATEIRAALAIEPWLNPYIEAADASIEEARDRFEKAQVEVLRRMDVDGIELERRYIKPNGLYTTSLEPHEVRR